MIKQYIIQKGPTFQYWITTYQDGVKIENTKVACNLTTGDI